MTGTNNQTTLTAEADEELRQVLINGGVWNGGNFQKNCIWLRAVQYAHRQVTVIVAAGPKGPSFQMKLISMYVIPKGPSGNPPTHSEFVPRGDVDYVQINGEKFRQRWPEGSLGSITITFCDPLAQ